MVIFAIVMVALALIAAVGFIRANRSPAKSKPETSKESNHIVIDASAPETKTPQEDVVTYLPADVPAILQEVLSSVPLATKEEAMMGCYGTMGSVGMTSVAPAGKNIHPFQTDSLDELISRTMKAVTQMETEQHIARFTVSTQAKSRTNPHVVLLAHSVEPKRIRLIRFWRTQENFIATLAD